MGPHKLFAMMESMPCDEFAKVAVTLWRIWYARQKIIHDEEYQSPLSTHLFNTELPQGSIGGHGA
jgi:hypothetical protein